MGLSITNASTEISSLLFYVDNQWQPLADSPLAFGQTSYTTYSVPGISGNTTNAIPYVFFINGYRQLSFAQPNSNNFVANLIGYFGPGNRYSIFITDSIRHGRAQYVLLTDSLAMADSAWAQVRFINLSPDAPAMDVYVFYDAGPVGNLLFHQRDYPLRSLASIGDVQRYARIKSGPYYFIATQAGTNSILLEGGLVLPQRSVTTIYAKGWTQGTGPEALNVGVIRYVQ